MDIDFLLALILLSPADYGQTTDEEDAPAPATANPQLLLRQPALSLPENDAQSTLPAVAAPRRRMAPAFPAGYRQGPRMGCFIPNRTKPFLMIDSTGDNFIFTPAKKRLAIAKIDTNLCMGSTKTSTANASPVTSQSTVVTARDDSKIFHSDALNTTVNPTLPSHSDSIADVLLPNHSRGHIQSMPLISDDVFFPRNSMGDGNAFYAADDRDESSNDSENVIDILDFINFGDESSEDNYNQSDLPLPTPTSTSPTGASTNAQHKTPPRSKSTAYEGVAGKFNQGQNPHQQQAYYSQLESSFDSHDLNAGRCAPANSPLSPPKKRKMSDSFGPIGSLGSSAKKTTLTHC